ncbi:MAG TPA: helix-turn-helix transcriptional regulator [Candidatus Limnocylindrales bacterium]|nr:helix-turn-helix transcriptional regulator [Candidatus Limnocylindrales bacterium]
MLEELRQELERQERSAAWLARKTDFDPSYVTRVLNGERKPSPVFQARAAEALGVAADQLFTQALPA